MGDVLRFSQWVPTLRLPFIVKELQETGFEVRCALVAGNAKVKGRFSVVFFVFVFLRIGSCLNDSNKKLVTNINTK